ncbi:hypothetical protein N7541_007196 [Penicillium brevicompactum]|uniref:Non-reducing end beta-L-arabinofuranosidase-like GH127 middle domain-containing protein n=1 Tax=Penicillium brevicompactum TaxID=5074 RepID=A0A9W9QZ16_PENBR|nr:hypothetical protein N7541_007196 [Penicillium brevicompactum]
MRHLYDFFRYVSNSSWIGGDQEYSQLNEGLPYWLNAIVPLAYTLQDERLKDDVHTVVSKILDLVQPDGWIGPETIESGKRLIWARTLVFLGLTNLVEADPETYEKPILDALYRFNELMHTMLKNNGTGMIYHDGDKAGADDYVWFRTRSPDMVVSLQWLLDHHPGNQTDILKENIDMIHQYSFRWEGWYTEQSYIKDDLNTIPDSVASEQWPFLHGVTVAEALKYAAVFRRSNRNESLLTTARNGVDWTFKYHGAASGTILADERLAGLSPYYGSELCTHVEAIYSLAYNYFAIGDPSYADRAELTAFNALPAAMWPDWTSHQYMTEPNQPFAKNLSATPFWNVNSVGQTFGIEPNYPCCTVNHPQGFPKFTMYSYLKNGERGLVHALLSPGQAKAQIGGKAVVVDCQTDYPFSTTLSYTVNSDTDFDFYLRVPEWSTGIKINGASSSVDTQTSLAKIQVPSGQTTIKYEIGAGLRIVSRANDTVAIYQGSILYSLYISPVITSEPPKLYSNPHQAYPEGTYPSNMQDHMMTNGTEWNVAIDPSTLKFHAGDGPLPSPTFDDGKLPMFVTAKACLIDWPLFKDAVPAAPPAKKDRYCIGRPFNATLRPYGSSKLHMSDLPTIDFS